MGVFIILFMQLEILTAFLGGWREGECVGGCVHMYDCGSFDSAIFLLEMYLEEIIGQM